MPFGIRRNSEKNLNNTNPVVATGPVQGKTYELPAEPVSTGLAGRSYEIPAETIVETNTYNNQGLGMNQGLNNQGLNNQGLGLNQGSNSVYQSGAYIQSANRSSITQQPTVIETIQKDVVIQERIHPVEKEEIQPIIYREREQLDVKQVTQMMHETQIQPTMVQQRELAPEFREAIVERGAPIQENIILPTTQRDATLRTQEIHAPILNETIKKTVIEEIQPVLERDVFVPTIIQNTQPIYEKIVEAPTVYREVREVPYVAAPVVAAPFVAAPVIVEREVLVPVVAAPVVAAPVQPITEHVTMSTTTTTTDSFVPAKLLNDGEIRNQNGVNNVAPINARRN